MLKFGGMEHRPVRTARLRQNLKSWGATRAGYRAAERAVAILRAKHPTAPALVLLAPFPLRLPLAQAHHLLASGLFRLGNTYRTIVANRFVLLRLLILAATGSSIQVKVISGWKENFWITVRSSEPVKFPSRFGGVPELFLSGESLVFNSGVSDTQVLIAAVRELVRASIPVAWPLQLLPDFSSEPSDGNFNSVVPLSFKLDSFREDPQFSYLTPSRRTDPAKSEHFLHALRLRRVHGSEAKLQLDRLLEESPTDGSVRQDVFHNDLTHDFFAAAITTLVSNESFDVIEIGGGYGGLASRVLRETSPGGGVVNYSIIDIPKTLALARAFLREQLDGKDFARLAFIDALGKGGGASVSSEERPTVGIATHSISELEPRQIIKYLGGVVARCDYFLISYQRVFRQNSASTEWILARLLRTFRLKSLIVTERGRVVTALLQRR
jgi:hypothetical protein